MVLESVAPDAAVSGAWPAGVGGFKNIGKKYGGRRGHDGICRKDSCMLYLVAITIGMHHNKLGVTSVLDRGLLVPNHPRN